MSNFRLLIGMVSIALGVMCGVFARMYAEMLWQHNADGTVLVAAILLAAVAVVIAAVAACD